MKVLKSIVAAGAFMLSAATAAQAALVTIDFESDVLGLQGGSFISASSPIVTFSASGIRVANAAAQSANTIGLWAEGDSAGLNLTFSTFVNSLSMDFGNDDPGFSEDRAILTVFNNSVQVGQTQLIYNKNDTMDENISISGLGQFDSAYLIFATGSGSSTSFLTEIVDNVTFNTSVSAVPLPPSAILFGTALLGMAGLRRRKRKAA